MSARHLKQIDILNLAKPYCEKYGVKLNRNDLSQYVNGKVEPGQTKLTVLGKALGVSEPWLMGYDVPMDSSKTIEEARNNDENNSDDLKAAFWGGEKDLPPEVLDAMWDDVREYAQYKMDQWKRKQDK